MSEELRGEVKFYMKQASVALAAGAYTRPLISST